MVSWLLKAEPDSRIVKGIDVKFSAADFEAAGVTNWEGVRSHEAKCILRDRIKLNHKCLFYASNTKIPGITALSICSKEGFPDFNAWDPAHPYYDAKSNEADPTWYMVELRFVSHLPHLVSLKLLQFLASLETPPECLEYLTQAHLDGIKKMALLNRGRLSVQPIEEEVYAAIELLGTRGGFEEMMSKVKKPAPKKRVKKEVAQEKDDEDGEDVDVKEEKVDKKVTMKKAAVSKTSPAKKRAKKEESSSEDEVIPKRTTRRKLD